MRYRMRGRSRRRYSRRFKPFRRIRVGIGGIRL